MISDSPATRSCDFLKYRWLGANEIDDVNIYAVYPKEIARIQNSLRDKCFIGEVTGEESTRVSEPDAKASRSIKMELPDRDPLVHGQQDPVQ